MMNTTPEGNAPMRVTALAVAAAALALTVATGCSGTPEHQDGSAAPAGSPAPSSTTSTTTDPTTATSATTPTPNGTGTTPANNTTAAKCTPGQLSGDIEQYSPPGQAGGSHQARLKLTNTGARCTMNGYVEVRLLSNGQVRPTRVTHTSGSYDPVTLNRGDSAWMIMVWFSTPGGDEQSCAPLVTGALITPPGASGEVEVAENIGQVCGHGNVQITALTATRPS
jgi:hypothetical protein